MDSPRYAENTITEYSIQQSNIIGDFLSDKTRYDLMSVLMICLRVIWQQENEGQSCIGYWVYY